MAEGLTLSAITAAFRSAGVLARIAAAGLLILLLAAIGYSLWARQPDYRVLFAKLSDRDGGAVVEALERLNIPYRLAEPDGAIEVPAEQLHAARYKLAAQGLPKGDTREAATAPLGGFGVSPFQEQLGYQRALEEDLVKSVQSIEGVASARLHLALPRQSAFLRERVPPAAVVLVRLQPGARLTEERVESVRHIIANSVPGMAAAQVSVVDQTGTLLAAGVAGLYRGLSTDQLDYARRLEKEFADRVVKMLSPVMPESDFKVQVTALVDFSESEETSEDARQSGRAVVRSHKTTRLVREPRGMIRRLAALVVIDEASQPERSRLTKLERLARQAIGFDPRRGDSVQVIAVPFKKPAGVVAREAAPASLKNLSAPAPAAGAQATPATGVATIYAGLALAAIAGLVLFWRGRRRKETLATETAAEPSPGEQFETELQAVRERVLDDPKVTASVIRVWMQS